MGLARRNAICRALAGARTARLTGIISALMALAGILVPGLPAVAQERAPRDVAVKQVAGDIYFLFDFEGSNSVFLVTSDGVLVIDTRTHPREGRDLLDRIRKVTDKPIKWVINSHFHGDHHMGNSVFKELGATFVAHEQTARLMQQVQPKEMARRIEGFKSRGYDPAEVKQGTPSSRFRMRARCSRPALSPDTACRTWRSRPRWTTGSRCSTRSPSWTSTPSCRRTAT